MIFLKNKLLLFAASALLAVTLTASAIAAPTLEEKARTLYDLGLLKGTSTEFSMESLELDRDATRAEVSVTIVRMLGKEKKAAYQENPHPFHDVPDWASDYVGWLYENYLVNGVSETRFGAEDIASVGQFSTMLLRVLGYDDAAGDFSYEAAVPFAQNAGLLDDEIATHYELSRRDMIAMCYNALTLPIKNSHRLLAAKLCDEGALDKALAESTGLLKPPSLSDAFPDVPETLGNMTASWEGTLLRLTFDEPVEEYGLRVFMRVEDNTALVEVPFDGEFSFDKGEILYQSGVAAGYVNDMVVYGLTPGAKYSFIVLKTTSEGTLYHSTGKSKPADIGE